MIRTRVGYSGGTRRDPTYRSIGDHSETVQMDFDPLVISYEELLDVFWRSHNPAGPSWSRQYMSAIFTHSEEQERLARKSKENESARRGSEVVTGIFPASRFYQAEDYHQKYYLRGNPELLREYTAIYPVHQDFVDSTAVARINGYVAGHGTVARLDQDLASLGLSSSAGALLLKLRGRSGRDLAGPEH